MSDIVIPKLAGTRGWREFLATKQDMLYKFDLAQKHSQSHIVQSYHGKVAEAVFREWLLSFLPKRFGVTSGYIISQEIIEDDQNYELRHYDVIIYDQLESPVLWTTQNPDESELGHCRAIPAEYVYGVIEVKSQLTRTSVKESVKKLLELEPFLRGVDAENAIYRKYFPQNIFRACVYYELNDPNKITVDLLNEFVPLFEHRGFHSIMVLRSDKFSSDLTAISMILPSEIKEKWKTENSSKNFSFDGRESTFEIHATHNGFSMFAFNLTAVLNGNYRSGTLPSLYGLHGLKEVDEFPDGCVGLSTKS